MTTDAPFRLSAVGDISFEGPEADNSSFEWFESIVTKFSRADLVVGNLECVLTNLGRDGIPGKCKLRGNPEWAHVLRKAGVGLVSLANNHVMDFGAEGLFSTIQALHQAGVKFVGAGRNRDQAHAPIFLDVAQRRVAFLARSAVIVSAPTYATDNDPGVAFLDLEETVDAIRACRSQVDLIVLMLHWGLEEYCYPSPAQRMLARQLLEAGADLILGQHPHVLQGYESVGAGVVAYSLGNFVFNEFEWTYVLPNGEIFRQFSPLSRENREGVIATFQWFGGGVPTITTVFTRIGYRGEVSIDVGANREAEWAALCTSFRRGWYGIWWRWYAVRREWNLRLRDQASLPKLFAKLHRIRLRHLADVFGSLRRSARIVSEKSTNPYE
jgi:Bacterial capsule synthesis protein PGA_cap